jgi:dolichol-phosphate mannosyltransferase
MNTAIAIVPTYNEAEMLPRFLDAFLAQAPTYDVLVVDDGSPDGTGALADAAALASGRVHVLHRTGKGGLGAAYRAGFAWALARGYERVAQMDCDLSHPPTALPALDAALDEGADVALGSRYVAGGGTEGWPVHRRVLSRVGCIGASAALGLPYADLTGGFKLWTAGALRRIDVATTAANGFVFQVETTQRAHRARLAIVQVPFTFRDRIAGTSKMRPAIALEGIRVILHLREDPWRPAAA